MLLDQYLLPLAELGFSIVLPLVLTLKTVQLSTRQYTHDPASPPHPQPSLATQRLLTFWLVYWLLIAFTELAGVNGHVRCLVAGLYYTSSDAAMMHLLRFYESSVLPFVSTLVKRTMNRQVSEAEVDRAAVYLLEKICFEPQDFTKSLVELAVSSDNHVHTQTPYPSRGSLWSKLKGNTKDDTFHYVPDLPVDNVVPLEIARVRSPPPYPQQAPVPVALVVDELNSKKSRRRGSSVGASSLSKKPSKQNLRVSSWTKLDDELQSDVSVISPPHGTPHGTPQQHQHTGSNVSSRIPSGDLVFDDASGDRRSLRGSLKGLFTTA